MSDIATFLSQIQSGDNADARDTINDLLSARATEALNIRKQEIAKSMYSGTEVESEQESTDTEETETETETQE